MNQYPDYRPQTVGDFTNPRNSSIPLTTPVNPVGNVMSGAYDGQQFPSQTVGQLQAAYAPQTYSTPIATPMLDDGGVAFGDMWDGNQSAFATPTQTVGDTIKSSIGSMSFGQKATALGGVAKGVFDAYNAYKTNKLAKEQFNFTKDNTNRNFEANANITNSQLADRQAARVARDPKQFASVSDYMSKYGVKV